MDGGHPNDHTCHHLSPPLSALFVRHLAIQRQARRQRQRVSAANSVWSGVHTDASDDRCLKAGEERRHLEREEARRREMLKHGTAMAGSDAVGYVGRCTCRCISSL